MTAVTVFVGVGSNLDNPQAQVATGLTELSALEQTRMIAASSLYRSVPMGPADQPDYINAVAMLETRLQAEALLDGLQAIETRHLRVRGDERWGPRTLDLDLLLYGDEQIDTARLRVPHAGLAERNFVLYPLAAIAPDLNIPGLGPLRELIARCPRSGLERLPE